MRICGYPVIGEVTLSRNGCFAIKRFYLKGWVRLPPSYHARYIHGLTGKETELTLDSIRPMLIQEVL